MTATLTKGRVDNDTLIEIVCEHKRAIDMNEEEFLACYSLTLDGPSSMRNSLERIEKAVQRGMTSSLKHYRVCLARHEDEIVGWGLIFNDNSNGYKGKILYMFANPEYRCAGIGKKILLDVYKRFHGKIAVCPYNELSASFYEPHLERLPRLAILSAYLYNSDIMAREWFTEDKIARQSHWH